MLRMKENYTKEVIPALKERFSYTNTMAVPRIEKVVVSVRTGKGLKDSQFNETVASTLERITGQRPVATLAKKSISNFKIREGMKVGMVVTLRGQRMYDFLDKLIHVTLPRVRDFRGLNPKSFDNQGNLSIGIREHVAFPEISADEVDRLHGVQVTVATSAKSREEGLALLTQLGFPFRQ